MSADKSRKRKHRNRKRLPLSQVSDNYLEPRELPSLPLLLTIPDAAFLLSCCPRHVYELEALGLLDLVKLGPKATRVTTASVVRLIAQRAKPSAQIPGLKQFTDTKIEPQTQK